MYDDDTPTAAEVTPAQQLEWYFDQAEQGDLRACRELGYMFFRGFTHPDDPTIEIQPDASVAIAYLTAAAEEGDGQGALILGQLLDGKATGGLLDQPTEAFRRYQQAVDLDYRPARPFLAGCYLIGRGVEQDVQLGRRILIEAAYAGDDEAQSFLAGVFAKDGDNEAAIMWRIVAGVFGCEEYQDMLDQRVPIDVPERARLTIQKVNIYSALIECDAPELIQAADLLRNEFYGEV